MKNWLPETPPCVCCTYKIRGVLFLRFCKKIHREKIKYREGQKPTLTRVVNQFCSYNGIFFSAETVYWTYFMLMLVNRTNLGELIPCELLEFLSPCVETVWGRQRVEARSHSLLFGSVLIGIKRNMVWLLLCIWKMPEERF